MAAVGDAIMMAFLTTRVPDPMTLALLLVLLGSLVLMAVIVRRLEKA